MLSYRKFFLLTLLAVIVTSVIATPPNSSIEVIESVTINAPVDSVWNVVTDFEGAFEQSNPDHRGTKILSAPKVPFRDSLRFYQKELVGGLTGELDGLVYDVHPPKRFRWEAEVTYNILGFNYMVKEGGTIRIEKYDPQDNLILSHRLYTKFKDGMVNQFIAWLSLNVLNMEEAASKHTFVELEYFKKRLES